MAVYLKRRAINNLKSIFKRLIISKTFPLSKNEAQEYINLIENQCFFIGNISIHKKTIHQEHKPFGVYVHRYKKNSNTTWYIIYNIDRFNNIIIKKILCNNQMKNKWQ